MIDIRHLIDFLPFYYKDKDTEKVNGKGILERFLEICGDYFTDNIKSVVDNSLDNINIDKASDECLAWIWELLGQMPFVNKINARPFNLTKDQQKDIIRYSTELLKIRGTNKFFEIMFRAYSNDVNNLELESITIKDDQFDWKKDYFDNNSDLLVPYLDVNDLDDEEIALDEYYHMKQCVDVEFRINGTFDDEDIESVRKSLTAFVRRFVPYNANPIVYINGYLEESRYYKLILEIYIQVDGEYRWVIPDSTDSYRLSDYRGSIPVRVYLVRTADPKNDDGEYLPVEGIEFTSQLNGGAIMTRESVYQFTINGVYSEVDTYTFKYNGFYKNYNDNVATLNVSRGDVVISRSYHLGSLDGNSFSLTRSEDGKIIAVSVSIESYYQDGQDKVPTPVQLLNTGEIKTPSNGLVTVWKFDKEGIYKFSLIDRPGIQLEISVRDNFRTYYEVQLAVAGDDNYRNNLSISESNLNGVEVSIKVLSNDPSVPEETKICKLFGTNLIYKNGSTFNPTGYGTFTFVPVYGDENLNMPASLNVTSGYVDFNTYISDRDANPSILNNSISATGINVKASPLTSDASRLVQLGLTWVIQKPTEDGTLETIVLRFGQDYSKTYENRESSTYITNKLSSGTLGIRVNLPGVYRIWPEAKPEAYVEWEVFDYTEEVLIPAALCIIPEDENENWLGGESSLATFNMSEDENVARYHLALLSTKNKYIPSDIKAIENDDVQVHLYDEISKSTPGVYEYVLTIDGKEFKAIMTVNDFIPKIDLQCLPSTSFLNNGTASTKLSISSNKSSDVLRIKENLTGDLYKDGDTFVAQFEGEYTFTAVVNGKEMPEVTSTFNVIDPTEVVVTPQVLEFDSDGNPISGNTFDIEANKVTEWSISIEES